MSEPQFHRVLVLLLVGVDFQSQLPIGATHLLRPFEGPFEAATEISPASHPARPPELEAHQTSMPSASS